MTTSRSPILRLQGQATLIARSLKRAAKGEANDDFGRKVAASLGVGATKFAVVMDDKTITIAMLWADIATMTEQELANLIVNEMKK